MVSEIGDVNAYDDRFLEWTSNLSESPLGLNFDDRTFRGGHTIPTLSKNVTLYTGLNRVEEKTKKAVLPMGFGVEGKVTVEWGGSDGVSVSGSASGNISDDSGNKAEAEISVNSDGSGSASISVSHDEDSDS